MTRTFAAETSEYPVLDQGYRKTFTKSPQELNELKRLKRAYKRESKPPATVTSQATSLVR